MAPLAGFTNGPFRRLTSELGCRVFWTEMIPAEGLVRRRPEIMAMLPDASEVRPVAVQLFGSEPTSMGEAAAITAGAGADWIDINMACPVRRLTGVGAGAALMNSPSSAAALVDAVSRRAGIPVTIKIRAGWDEQRGGAMEIALACREAGAAAVTIHGRTRAQGFRGRADHSAANLLVRALGIPVIVSGDITGGATARSALAGTGAAAVMIGRGAIGDPWIFHRIDAYLEQGEEPRKPDDAERLRVMLRHLELLEEEVGPGKAVSLFKPHLMAHLKGRSGAANWRLRMARERSIDAVRRGLAACLQP
jgi:tRNA-dihydrouridine synthase B